MQEDYYYSFGRIKALETKLIPRVRMEELARARSVQEVLAHLEETEYTHYLAQARTMEEFEREFLEAVERTYALCEKMVPEKWIVGILTVRKEFESYKQALRNRQPLPEELTRLVEGKDFFGADLALDREMFSRIVGMAKDADVSTLVRKEIDLCNSRSLVRAKENGEKFDAWIGGGLLSREELERGGMPAASEKEAMNLLLAEAKRLALEKMDSPMTVYSFLLEKETEALELSAIIKSKIMGLEAPA